MATLRDTPYPAFNFTVAIDGGTPADIAAGFAEVTGLDQKLGVLRYRTGNSPVLHPVLLPGLPEPVTVTLSRGVIGDLSLYDWILAGLRGAVERRDVRIDLLAEDRDTVALGWRLRRAWPTALLGPSLDAVANAVAVERLVLVAESLTTE